MFDFHAIMTLFNSILLICVVVSLMILLLGFYFLLKTVNYPFMDTSVLLGLAKALNKFIFTNRMNVEIADNDVSCIDKGQISLEYNVYLNIIKLFPESHRLRYAQIFNCIIFFLFLCGLYIIQFLILDSYNLHNNNHFNNLPCLNNLPYLNHIFYTNYNPYYNNYILLVPLVFTLIVGIRTKLMLVVCFALSDVINYFFFIILLILLFIITDTPSNILSTDISSNILTTKNSLNIISICIGLIIGLAFRNRRQDGILLIACFIYLLFYSNIHWYGLFLYSLSFGIVNIDWFYFEFTGNNKKYNNNRIIAHYFRRFGAIKINKDSDITAKKIKKTAVIKERVIRIYKSLLKNYESLLKNLMHTFLDGLFQSINPYSNQSFWVSLGSIIILTPISISYLAFTGYFHNILIFLILFFISLWFPFLFIRHRYISGETKIEQCYFSGRQFYILFPVFIVINGIAFAIAYSQQNLLVCSVYIIYIFYYLCHHTYRLLDYYFSEFISESGFIYYDKTPDLWRVELADFINSVQRPAVIMGNHLAYGVAYNYYDWSNDIQCVDIHCVLTDDKIIKIINDYKVTHIVITPGSPLKSSVCSLNKQELSSQLKSYLMKIQTNTPNLLIYEII